MDLINNVLSSPLKVGALTVGAAAVTHLFFALDLLVTGGVVVVGGLLAWRAHSKSG